MKMKLQIIKIHVLTTKDEIQIKSIGARQGILREHKQNTYKNETGKQARSLKLEKSRFLMQKRHNSPPIVWQ